MLAQAHSVLMKTSRRRCVDAPLADDLLVLVQHTFDQINSGEVSLEACIREDRWLAEWAATKFIAVRDDIPFHIWTATPRIHRVFHLHAELQREQRGDYDAEANTEASA